MGRSHSLSIEPGAINDIAAAELQDNQDNNARNTFASTIIPRQEDLQLASYERPIKNQRVRFNFNVETIKIKNNEVAKCDSFKIPATNAEDLHYDKRGIIQTAFGSPMHVHNQNSDEYSRRNRPNSGLHQRISAERTFYTPCKREARKSDSDDDITSSEARASTTCLLSSGTKNWRRTSKTIMAIMDKFQGQNCKFSSECLSKSPELLNPPTSTTMMQLPMRLEELHRISSQLYLRRSFHLSLILPKNPKTQTSTTNAPSTENAPPEGANAHQEVHHPMFANTPTNCETFFDDNEHENNDDDLPQTPLTSPDGALTSSTRTDFTYPPIEDLTRTLLKYAKIANLQELSFPTDLLSRRRQFNAFMDNLRIICSISPWTRQVFDLWPRQINYSHPCVGIAIFNLIFTNICEPCQTHIIDCSPDARTAILTLRRHCAPLTQDHIERRANPSTPSSKDIKKLQHPT
ncbi:hypothetical protein MHU86_12935 [Fragilaria crotonensis]|nr:hypothetical protein MHU86_12935 [Fragilaria crotonensis]